jgi:hypothetical protein
MGLTDGTPSESMFVERPDTGPVNEDEGKEGSAGPLRVRTVRAMAAPREKVSPVGSSFAFPWMGSLTMSSSDS